MVDWESHTFLRHLIANVKCAVCHHQYEPDDIQVIERHEELWILGVTCGECQTQGLIFAIVREVPADEVQSPDYYYDEEDRILSDVLTAIKTDEVLDMHCLLRDFDGDMYDLLVSSGQ